MSPRATAPRREADPERTEWRRRDAAVSQLAQELARLHREHQLDPGHQHHHAAARTLNLIVAPVDSPAGRRVRTELERLGRHSPSRTIELRLHSADRLDAEAAVLCNPSPGGRLAICHDRVVLRSDAVRLAHAGSLIAPLLVDGLPTVLWLPDPTAPVPDPGLLERADYVLLDGAGPQDGLPAAAALAERITVRDLAWGRLERGRAAVASAWDPPGRRRLLPAVEALEISYPGPEEEPLLLAGWIAARAGWGVSALSWDANGGRGRWRRPDGGSVRVSVLAGGSPAAARAVMRAGREEVEIDLAPCAVRRTDVFATALAPRPGFERGYREALAASLAARFR